MDRRRPDYDDNRVASEYRAWVSIMAAILCVGVVFAVVGELLVEGGTEAEQPTAP